MSTQNKELFAVKKESNRRLPAAPIPALQKEVSMLHCLLVFKRLLQQTQLKLAIKKTNLRFYDRIFTPAITLWCMMFQRLNHDHTLQAVVCALHSGKADLLSTRKTKPLSMKIRSLATTAFSKARTRLPCALLANVLSAQATELWHEIRDEGQWHGLRVLLLDGTQVSLRPHPEILKHFATSTNQNGKIYWVLMRSVATFCLHTGMVVASAVDSTTVSEQTLALRQIP